MRKKIYNILNKVYGVLMTVSFFAGVVPFIPFIVAIIVGGQFGETVSVFLYKQYYPWVIIIGSIAVVIGLIAMYIGKIEGLSVKKTVAEESDKTQDGKTEGEENK